MAWSTMATQTTGDLITAAIWNVIPANFAEVTPAKVTTAGDTVYGTGANAIARLGIGTARQALQTNAGATAPEWAASPQSVLTVQADLLYASAANVLARLAIGTAGHVLRVNSGATAPEWGEDSQALRRAYLGV